MFTEKDLAFIKEKGMTVVQIEKQLQYFKNGFPSLQVVKPATTKDGIKQYAEKKQEELILLYEKSSKKLKKVKFVPASGAASRMFKSVFEVMNTYKGTEEDYLNMMADRGFNSIYYLCQNLKSFAFYTDLQNSLAKNQLSIEELSKNKDVVSLLKNLLTEEGLNYGNLPKGLLKFHKCDDGERTPVEEHLIEGVNYAVSGKKVFIHFTVSPDHLELFKKHIDEIRPKYEKKYQVKYDVSYSIQKTKTDTIAVDEHNEPFRNGNGKLIFRPGGHGALIENLNELKSDIIFIKNIDNVVQDRMKNDTLYYKKVLAGALLEHQEKVFKLVKKLKKRHKEALLLEAEDFLRKKLNVNPPDNYSEFSKDKKTEFLLSKLDRPLRVCGMVANEGEPGGGPFWVKNADGSSSLQIVEGSQISEDKKDLLNKSTHFNPVDLVCATKNYKGHPFDLTRFVDHNSGFISSKSFEGKELKALELPGLWNGAMADWNTLFVEVPISTFNPVKTVNDLLRAEHLYEKDWLTIQNGPSLVD